MKLVQVTGRQTEKCFLDVPRMIYRNDPFWVCPLDRDIRDAFDPRKNRFLKGGDGIRWILMDDLNKPAGRIAAFYNQEKAMAEKIMSGGAGFFECINNQKGADLLFNAAKEWLSEKGMKAMDAPVNFGENDSNWGLLVDGFTQPGIGMPYNLPYYKELFDNFGFRVFFRQYTYHLDLAKKFPERFWKIAEWISKKPDFSFRHFSWKDADKFVTDMAEIYNRTWHQVKEDFTPISREVLTETMHKAKPIIDCELIWFAYHKDEPISFFIMFPDANMIFRKFNGKLNLWNMIRFIYYKETNKISRIRAIVAGVVPKFQNSGVESGIFWHLNEKMKHKPQYKEIELSWVGDFNPKMMSLYESVGGVRAKIHHTYRYMIDQSIPFERFMPERVMMNQKL
jgi:hypothetical protein